MSGGSPDGDSPVAQAAVQVRAVLSAAEQQAREIRERAEHEAREIRERAEGWSRESAEEREATLRQIQEDGLTYLEEAKSKADAVLNERAEPLFQFSEVIKQRANRVIGLLEDAERVKGELRELVNAAGPGLDRAVAQARAEVGGAVALAEPPRPDVVESVEEDPTGAQEPASEPDPDAAESARLVALQMAIQGRTRGDVEERLEATFALPNPQDVLDDVFGAGSSQSHRIAWTNGS
jgi:hypothetical protein